MLAWLFLVPGLNFEAISWVLEKKPRTHLCALPGTVPGCEVCKFLRQPLYKRAPRHTLKVRNHGAGRSTGLTLRDPSLPEKKPK